MLKFERAWTLEHWLPPLKYSAGDRLQKRGDKMNSKKVQLKKINLLLPSFTFFNRRLSDLAVGDFFSNLEKNQRARMSIQHFLTKKLCSSRQLTGDSFKEAESPAENQKGGNRGWNVYGSCVCAYVCEWLSTCVLRCTGCTYFFLMLSTKQLHAWRRAERSVEKTSQINIFTHGARDYHIALKPTILTCRKRYTSVTWRCTKRKSNPRFCTCRESRSDLGNKLERILACELFGARTLEFQHVRFERKLRYKFISQYSKILQFIWKFANNICYK